MLLIIRNISIYILTIFFVTAFLTAESYSQNEGKGRRQHEGTGPGIITGIVVDSATNNPLENATVTVVRVTDSVLVNGALTGSDGKFRIDKIPYGSFLIKFNFIGYEERILSNITINSNNTQLEMGTVTLAPGSITVEGVTITAEKNIIQFTPEKKIFNVSETPLTSNGSATDVLKNVPSVSVDNDGNVSLRGSQNVRILLDGKPLFDNASKILESIPASSVDKVELITNPTAKYEAEGETGFINVILKKSEDFGYNGNIVLSIGDKDKYNVSGAFNLKNKKLNVFANYSFQSSRFESNGTSQRENIFNSSTSTLNQPSSGQFKILSNLVKAGFDYNVTDKQTLSLSSTLGVRNRNRNQLINNDFYDEAGILSSSSLSNNTDIEKGYNIDAVLDYVVKFKKPDQHLEMEASYTRRYEDNPINIINEYYVINYNNVNTPNGMLSTEQLQYNNFLNFQADYTHPFSKDTKLETGVKSTYRYNDNNNSSEHLDSLNNVWISDVDLNNELKYREFINAAYISFFDEFGNLGIQAGLRSELTFTKGDLVNDPSQDFTKHYVDFFPNASISEKLDKTNEFQLSYNRRLNRPRPGMLNPFREVVDPYNVHQGNPDLNPEYIDAYELSYLKYFKGGLVTSSIFFHQTHGLISRYRTMIDSLTALTQPVNLSKANSYGFEIIGNLNTPQWLNLNGSFTYYKTDIQGGNIQPELSNSGYTWTTKLLGSIKMWFGLELSMIYNYSSKRPVVDGFIEPMQYFDVSLKKVFLDKKLDMSLKVSDLFNSQKFQINTENTGYTQNSTFKRESRVAYLTLTYRFGKDLNSKKKNGTHEQNNENDMEE
jgi:outer membrane receptor protein involved in Fe transport